MSIYRDKNSRYWYVDLSTASGKRIRRSTGTTDKAKAQEFHDRLKVQIWEAERLGVKPKYTFEQAALKMLELSEGQTDYNVKLRHVKYWREIFGGRTICSLTQAEVLNNLPTNFTRYGKRRSTSNATKNRYIATIRRIYNVAYDMGWVDSRLRVAGLKEKKVNIRWITEAEAEKLLACIDNTWLRAVAEFALYTGCRASEVLNLRWSNVDLDRSTAWVVAANAKSGRARPVPLNKEALAVLYLRKGMHDNYCFGRVQDKPSAAIDNRIFNCALEKAGIRDFRFHDLRHTWASWHAQAGTPLMVLKELGGWETLDMVMKYAHLSTSHLAEFAGNISGNKKAAMTELCQSSSLQLVS